MTPEEIRRFWFADALTDPSKALARVSFWFESRRETDQHIAQRFAAIVRDAGLGAFAAWESQPRSCLSLIIVLDQFPRNIHRGTAPAFQHDLQALDVTRRGVAAGFLRELQTVEQAFFLMPFQHSEDLAAQREGIVLCQRVFDEAAVEWRTSVQGFLSSARQHLQIIERFGRFPHRNGILGRASTPAEREYLESNGESFGQRA